MSISYDGNVFRSVASSTGGDVGPDTTFHYHQNGDLVWATYTGGAIRFGTLIATADGVGNLDMRYQHLARDGSFCSGRCRSWPERLPDGRLRLHERWQWTEGRTGGGRVHRGGDPVAQETGSTPRSSAFSRAGPNRRMMAAA